MAFVHICFDHIQGRPYAVKSLKQDVLDAPGVREAFLRPQCIQDARLAPVQADPFPHGVRVVVVQPADLSQQMLHRFTVRTLRHNLCSLSVFVFSSHTE